MEIKDKYPKLYEACRRNTVIQLQTYPYDYKMKNSEKVKQLTKKSTNKQNINSKNK